MTKKPRAAISVRGEKVPAAGIDPEGVKRELISWRLSLVDMEGPWGWRTLSNAHLDDLHSKLCNYEQLTLGEVMKAPGNTPIEINDLSGQAQKRLREIKQDDLGQIWHLRLKGKWRVWGKIEGSVFYFLWWDPEHSVQEVAKRNT